MLRSAGIAHTVYGEMEVNIDMVIVTVIEYGGAIREKILVAETEDALLVTTRDEWDASQRDARTPVTVGFRKEYEVSRQSI